MEDELILPVLYVVGSSVSVAVRRVVEVFVVTERRQTTSPDW